MAVTHYVEAHLPNVTLEGLDAAGHCPHMSHPDATTAAIDAYLNGAPAQSPDYA
jgi:sigma-B regulation protein RsbQ